MKNDMIRTAAAAVLAVTVLTGCSTTKKPAMSATTPAETKPAVQNDLPVETQPPTSRFDGVEDAADGAHLTISKTTAKPGEIADVTLSVSGVDKAWSMCGLHIVYPDVLECQMFNEEERLVKVKKGDAVAYASGSIAMLWKDNLTEDMIANKQKSVFFTAVLDQNHGLDGDICTYSFKVPEDAVPGTVYPIDYYYCETDMFSNYDKDPSFDKYAFDHWQGGSITVE